MRDVPAFDVRTTVGCQRLTVAIVGELDISTARRLERSVPQVDPATVLALLDVGGLTFVDIAGLRALAGVRNRLQDQGVPVRFENPPRPLTRIVDILGLDLDVGFHI